MGLTTRFLGAFALMLLVSGCGTRPPQAVFSPDGQSLAFTWADQGLHQINLDGSGFRPIRLGKDVADPSWSPNGKWLLMSDIVGKSDRRIKTILYDLENRKELDTLDSIFFPALWSADGSEVAALSMDGKQRLHLQVRSVPDGRLKRDTPIWKGWLNPGDSLQSIEGLESIATMGFTGKGQWNLLSVEKGASHVLTRSGDVTAFRVDAANRRILYIRQRGSFGPPALWEYDLRARSARKLDFRCSAGDNTPEGQQRPDFTAVSISPKLDRILLDAGTAAWNAVFTCRMDGTDLRRVEECRYSDRERSGSKEGLFVNAQWSQTGDRIVVMRSNGDPAIRVYDPDGSNPRLVPLPALPDPSDEPNTTLK
jgi:Tol biopolymer transport system component